MEVTPALRALVDELRVATEQIVSCEVPAERLEDALELARQLRGQLVGPRRTPWYEIDASDPRADHSRAQFDALSPYGGSANALAPPMKVELPTSTEGRVVGRVRLARCYEGPPRGVHGGVVAGLFDDLLGNVMALAPPIGVTGKLEITYRQVTPIETDLVFEGWVAENRSRIVIAKATCHAGGELTAEARGMFVRVDFRAIAERQPSGR